MLLAYILKINGSWTNKDGFETRPYGGLMPLA